MLGFLGCSSPSITEQARHLGTQPFSKIAWSRANQEQRGEMVFSFLSQHDPRALTADAVTVLLERSTGYYGYEENPAYLVGPATVESEYGKGYLLAFIADKELGRIVAVKIIPTPKSSTSIAATE